MRSILLLYITRKSLWNTLVEFLEEQEMEAAFALVALVLSLCHQSHQCWPPSQESSRSPSSTDYWGFEGSIFKVKPEYSTPRGVKIHWINFMEGDDVRRDGTAFKMITESNDINENNFKISVSKI